MNLQEKIIKYNKINHKLIIKKLNDVSYIVLC